MIPICRGEADFHVNSGRRVVLAIHPEAAPKLKVGWILYICPPEQIDALAGTKGENYVLYFDLTHQFHMGFRWS